MKNKDQELFEVVVLGFFVSVAANAFTRILFGKIEGNL